jgi:hypothetical protein
MPERSLSDAYARCALRHTRSADEPIIFRLLHVMARVERSLYQRANGYNYEAVKIFMPANREKPVVVPYIEHVPPDTTADIFWMKNRDPQHWRDSQQLEHVLGKYLISDKPMSEEDWARERADVIDEQTNNDEPRFGDGREERHLESAKRLDKPK